MTPESIITTLADWIKDDGKTPPDWLDPKNAPLLTHWIVGIIEILLIAITLWAVFPRRALWLFKSKKPFSPSIAGRWEEESGVDVDVTQSGRKWSAKCTYARGTYIVSWVMDGEILPVGAELLKRGRIKGTLRYQSAPLPPWFGAGQERDGYISWDGNSITGKAIVAGEIRDFTWTKKLAPIDA